MTMGSSDGEKDEDCKEARGVLVEGGELWLVAHFKSVSVKFTPENICIKRPPKTIFSISLLLLANGLLCVFLWLFSPI